MDKRFSSFTQNHYKIKCTGQLICSLLFLCGCICGTVMAGLVSEETRLTDYFSSFLSFFASSSSVSKDLPTAFADVFKYNIIALLLSFSILGVFLIPLLSALRGFFLCFSISLVVRAVSSKGCLLALSLFGLNTLLTIPCFLIISNEAFLVSLYILRVAVAKNQISALSPFNKALVVRLVFCLLVLVIAAVLDCFFTPRIISYIVSRI